MPFFVNGRRLQRVAQVDPGSNFVARVRSLNTASHIPFSIRHMLPGGWHRRLQEIILQTAEIGVELPAENIDVTGKEGEALWRYNAYRTIHCRIDSQRMSRPAQPFGGIEQ
jgi:hypothetical protein